MLDTYIDYESRSRVPIRDGTDRYMTGAEATICTLAVGDGPVKCWDILAHAEPGWYTDACENPDTLFIAHNSQFDYAVHTQLLKKKTRNEQWHCTRAQAYAHGLPGGLEGVGEALGVPMAQQKSNTGKALIQLFCVPMKDGTYREPKDYPTEWEAFKQYAIGDIHALRAVHKRLPTHNFTGANIRYFWLDAKINRRGFAVDLPLIEDAIDLLDRAKGHSDTHIANATGGAVTAITQRDKLITYLASKGCIVPNLRKAELETLLQTDDLSPEHRLIIEARLEGARASGAKYKRATQMHVGGRLRYTQQFSGAGRTGRTAHKGFQPGNMPRAITYNGMADTLAEQHVPVKAQFIDDIILPAIRDGSALDSQLIMGGPNTVCANALRHMIIAEPGNELVVADYKNIESDVLAWLAQEDWKTLAYTDSFAGRGQDMYKMLYSRFFGVPMEKISDHERQVGKVIELACGFGGSVGAFVTMAATYGIDLSTLPTLVLPNAEAKAITKAEKVWWRAFLGREDYDLEPDVFIACHVLVQAYRAANPRIDGLKKAIGRAVENAVKARGSVYEVGRCKVWANRDLLIVELPSGYRLCYWAPEIRTEEVLDVETGETEARSYLSFKRARGPRMVRERSWPGLTLENIVQATANQLLRYGKLEIDAAYPDRLVLAVHDEAVAEAPVGLIDFDAYASLMCKGWWWTQGLPLKADGWVGPRYGKR